MGFRFRKSFGSGPFRFNLSKSGFGWSFGGKAARFTKKAGGGYRTTASIPGAGISYSKDHGGKRQKKSSGCFGSVCILFLAALLFSMVTSCFDGSLFEEPEENPAIVESADGFGSVEEGVSQESDLSADPKEPELTPEEQKAAELAAASIAAMQANQSKEDAANAEQDADPEQETPEEDPQPEVVPEVSVEDPQPETPVEEPVVETPPEEPVVEEDPEPQVEIVYITDTGSKYHRGSCRHLAKSKHEISLDDAIARGYTACGTCH